RAGERLSRTVYSIGSINIKAARISIHDLRTADATTTIPKRGVD
ncbi:MAG: hypothetical protein ACI9W2_004757, partial [Gammaproteobacteria bacterium]